MKSRLEKIVRAFVLGILVFAIPSSEPETALGRTRKRYKVQAKETVTRFLSSVRLVKKGYDFDHDGDGLVDMSVYLLKTEDPDLESKYLTVEEAISKKQLIIKENPSLSVVRKDPPSSYSVFGQYSGSRPLYSPRGGQLGAGWQNRGFRRGGVIGGGSYGRRYYEGSGSGRRRYGRGYGRGYRHGGFSGIGSEDSGLSGLGFERKFQPGQNKNTVEPVEQPGFEIDALCFEKWRLIEESRKLGEPEYFYYAGMASPFVRKELVLFPNQIKAHIAIEKELRRLGIHSRTKALADVFKDRNIKEIIDYYVANSKEVLEKNKGISGMIITSRNRILCADIFPSPDLFKQMFSQLMQSAALGVCRTHEKSKKDLGKADVEEFLHSLKSVEKLKKETSQTYRLCSPRLVSEAVLYSDEDGMRLVHIEAYPRS